MAPQETPSCHVPIMPREVCEMLRAAEGGKFLDCTLGGGGHTRALLEAHHSNEVIAIDRDEKAIHRAQQMLSTYSERVKIQHAAFSDLKAIAQENYFVGMLADLGFSSDQMASGQGFSFLDQGRLDMRMDQSRSLTAEEVTNAYPEPKLRKVLLDGGVKPQQTGLVARAITKARPIKTPKDLAHVINQALAGKTQKKAVNPATVVFQAIRIEVNNEISEIEALLAAAPTLVQAGGRLAIITFHSIEDKIVTARMRGWQAGDDYPALWPQGLKEKAPRQLGRILTKKPITPDDAEVARNTRARGARLRVFEFHEA